MDESKMDNDTNLNFRWSKGIRLIPPFFAVESCIERGDCLKSRNIINLTINEQDLFREYSIPLIYPKNHEIFSPGDLPNYIYLIECGGVKIYRITLDGKNITNSIRYPGEIFGLAEALCDMPRQCFASAIETVKLQAIKKEDFFTLLINQPQLNLKVSQILSGRLRHAETFACNLVSYNIEARLASLLLNLSSQCGRNFNGHVALDIILTHNDIASMIGSSRQSVSLVLQQFKKSKIIDYYKRKIVILDFTKLRKIV